MHHFSVLSVCCATPPTWKSHNEITQAFCYNDDHAASLWFGPDFASRQVRGFHTGLLSISQANKPSSSASASSFEPRIKVQGGMHRRCSMKRLFQDSRYTRPAMPVLAVINFHIFRPSLFTLSGCSRSPTFRPFTLPIIPTDSPPQSSPQNPVFRRDLLLILSFNPLLLTRLLNHFTFPQSLEHDIIFRSRKVDQAHSLATCLLTWRIDDSVNVTA